MLSNQSFLSHSGKHSRDLHPRDRKLAGYVMPGTQTAFQVSRTGEYEIRLVKKDTLECLIVPSFTKNLIFIE